MSFALVIPFHNERQALPPLVDSLRTQSRQVELVFVDNGSTDGSAIWLRNVEEVRKGKWALLEENRVGKRHAICKGAMFCLERFGVSHVGFVDADSTFADDSWIANSLDIVDRVGTNLGYTYSQIAYCDLDHLPRFETACRAYEAVLAPLIADIGWLANGQAFLCSTDILTRYLQEAEVTTEFDLRCSLLALAHGRQARFNRCQLNTSPRRILVDRDHFASWCFYQREFYSQKDINSPDKLDLNGSVGVTDLDPALVDRFFQRRALKVVARHLIPFTVFADSSEVVERLQHRIGGKIRDDIAILAKQFRSDSEWLLTSRFEEMIQTIESNRVTVAVAEALAEMMRRQYDSKAPAKSNIVNIAAC